MMWVANCAHTDIVNLSIEIGDDINATDDYGCTALMDESGVKIIRSGVG